ncbi:Os05g0521700 [Oryza sativa Japonica Group]|uniref:Os05g0521700 protein n=1 Tax=Oryza sativa subsp. japonica TaxID=39947 RepID=A0A0P0WPZ9_ORYSJ|nr:hypothetical protein EE612_030692 [Oryza sativa]BAS94949.1 Os05g0521700 [Oryza sativa Japonica Group]
MVMHMSKRGREQVKGRKQRCITQLTLTGALSSTKPQHQIFVPIITSAWEMSS